MANRLQKQPVLTYVPGIEAVAARAAFCSSWSEVTSYKSSPYNSGESYARSQSIGLGTPNYGYSGPISALTPVYTVVTRCYPAVIGVKGVPPRIDKTANNGWNGGARSIASIPKGSYIKVSLPNDPIGVLVGLSAGQFNHSYSGADYALVARPNGITVIKNGNDVTGELPLGSNITISRTSNAVRMLIDDSLVYSDADGRQDDMYASVLLYALSDYVEDPSIGAYGEYVVTSELLQQTYIDYRNGGTSELKIKTDAVPVFNGAVLIHGESYLIIESDASYIAKHESVAVSELSISSELVGYGYFGGNGNITSGISYASGMASFAGAASTALHAKARGSFSKPSLDARANKPEAEVIQAIGFYPAPVFSGHVFSGTVSQADGVVAVKGKASDAQYFGGKANAATINKLTAWQSYMGDDQLDGTELLFSLDVFNLEANALFILHEGIGVSDSIDFYLIINLDAYEGIAVSDTVSLASIIELAISERMAISGSSEVARREALQYAVNAVTGALSSYQNFGFKQFATVRGQTYAITDNGLYKLAGDTDNGDLLNASIDFGASDFGTSQLKRVSSVYAGVATDGKAYIRVIADGGQEIVYKAITEQDECRVKTAKGLAAKHWRVRLELTDASYADLDNLEIEIGVSQRRLGGRG